MKTLYQQTKGGVGKTTLAVHHAVYLHDRGQKVALLDCEPTATAARWVTEAEKGITVVHVTDAPSAGEALLNLEAEHNSVIIDSPGKDDSTIRTLLLFADLVVLPVGPSILELRTLGESVSLISEANKEVRKIPLEARVVCNQVKLRGKTSRELPGAASQYGIPLTQARVRALEQFKEAPKQGSVATRMGLSMAMIDAEDLFDELSAIGANAAPKIGNE